MTPKLNIFDFFIGNLEADGILFDFFGRPKRYFHAEMRGKIKGKTLTLNEEFIFDDGEKTHRVWEITSINDQDFFAKAHDVIGMAKGQQMGNSVNMSYNLRIPYKNSTLDLSMDDWMYLINDRIILNRTSMKKFGIKVGELVLFIKKKS